MVIAKETEAQMWKIKCLLWMRAFTKKKVLKVKHVAEAWDVTERTVFRDLAEADEIFNSLIPYFWMQPDLNQETVNRNLAHAVKEMGLADDFVEYHKKLEQEETQQKQVVAEPITT